MSNRELAIQYLDGFSEGDLNKIKNVLNDGFEFNGPFYPPSQETTGVSPWMHAMVGPAVALAKVGASADSAEEKGRIPWV